MMVTPHNLSEPETIGLSVPPGGGNFSLMVGMSFDEAPMKAAAAPAAPFAHVPICNIANHSFNAVGLNWSSLTRNPNATIKTPLAVNSMCAITMPRNHATAEGGMNPTIQPTVIWRTPRIRVQRLMLAFKLSMSVVIISRFTPLDFQGRVIIACTDSSQRMLIAHPNDRWVIFDNFSFRTVTILFFPLRRPRWRPIFAHDGFWRSFVLRSRVSSTFHCWSRRYSHWRFYPSRSPSPISV